MTDQIASILKSWGEPAYRLKQVDDARRAGARDWDEVTTLPKDLRARRAEVAPLGTVTPDAVAESRDGTIKWRLRTNIVVMGMGEPLANYDNLLAALRIVNAPWGFGFGARRITISTSGVVPKILKLADEELGFRLAISLHGATNEVRNQIMPVNRKFPLEELVPAAKAFARKHGRMLTLEFILIEDINDTLEQAGKLRDIALDLHAHVNLIPYNTVAGLDWRRPSLTRQERFAEVLRAARVSVTLRREKGHDIDAACGQLRLRTEREGLPANPVSSPG